MAGIELIGVPFDGDGRPGNQASARVVGAARGGTGDRLRGTPRVDRKTGDLTLPAPSTDRGRDTSLINEVALLAMTDGGARPGGPCGGRPTVSDRLRRRLLRPPRHHPGAAGPLRRRRARPVDGHEDTMPLDVSEDGEAANAEIGLLLGITGRLLRGPLGRPAARPRPAAIAIVGQKDDEWWRELRRRRRSRTEACGCGTSRGGAGPGRAGREAAGHVRARSSGGGSTSTSTCWTRSVIPAQGLPDVDDDPGGLTWEQLTETADRRGAGARLPGMEHRDLRPRPGPRRRRGGEDRRADLAGGRRTRGLTARRRGARRRRAGRRASRARRRHRPRRSRRLRDLWAPAIRFDGGHPLRRR